MIEKVEIREALAELRKLETDLKQAALNIAIALRTTWTEMLNHGSGSEKYKANFNAFEKLTEETAQIHSALILLQKKVQAGLTNNDNSNGMVETAVENLPALLNTLISEAGELRMHLSTAKHSLDQIVCPALIIRQRIAEITKIPQVGTDDLILNKKEPDDEGHGVGF
jgi:hypothetical protein